MNKPDQSQLLLQEIASPSHTNFYGNIFGGWLVSQMDIAAFALAKKTTGNNLQIKSCVTVSIDTLKFINPVYIGDLVSYYGCIDRLGKTSITMNINVWATRNIIKEDIEVTNGYFTYVALDDNNKPTSIKITNISEF